MCVCVRERERERERNDETSTFYHLSGLKENLLKTTSDKLTSPHAYTNICAVYRLISVRVQLYLYTCLYGPIHPRRVYKIVSLYSQEKLVEVEQFQVEACEEVARLNQASSENTAAATAPSQTLSTARLEALIERGGQFEFHIPELDTLKLALQQNQWVTETKGKLRLEMQTVEGLKAMAKQGTNLMRGSTGVFIIRFPTSRLLETLEGVKNVCLHVSTNLKKNKLLIASNFMKNFCLKAHYNMLCMWCLLFNHFSVYGYSSMHV